MDKRDKIDIFKLILKILSTVIIWIVVILFVLFLIHNIFHLTCWQIIKGIFWIFIGFLMLMLIVMADILI